MPYRIDIENPPAGAMDLLVEMSALDIEAVGMRVAAILPDSVSPEQVCGALPEGRVSVSEAMERDDGSVWLLSQRTVRVGSLIFTSREMPAAPNAIRLIDGDAFGTGHHPTTAMCLEALEEIALRERPGSVLDVGTGSGILAIAALMMGVPEAVGLDIDSGALEVAAENTRLNGMEDRLRLVTGGPAMMHGQWPVVVANVLAAPLIDMAPALVQRLGPSGQMILSGIPWCLESEVRQAYQHCGMRAFGSKTRAGWTMLTAQASW